ncbi:MAG TPA: hypothetical protein VKU60_10395, partial [Chloroflexota bacterium]|nr:hypothetical protein [Chloroflexota bacterium]
MGLLTLFVGEAVCLASGSVKLPGRLLVLDAAQQVGGFLQAFSGTAGIGRALICGIRALHVLAGLLDLVKSLLDAGVVAALRALRAAIGSGLPGLAGLAGLAGVALLALTLLPVLGHLLHLLLQLFGFAPQHFLLPALILSVLRGIARLVRQLLLAPGQLLKLLEGVVNLLLLLVLRAAVLTGLVLVFFGIQLEIEEAGQVAAGSATPSAASACSKGHGDLAEGGFGAQQVLEGLLLVGDSVIPLLLVKVIAGRAHGLGGCVHIVLKFAKLLISVRQFTLLQAARKGEGLIAQLGLHAGEEITGLSSGLLGGGLVALLLPGGGDNLLLALGDLGLVVGAGATTT